MTQSSRYSRNGGISSLTHHCDAPYEQASHYIRRGGWLVRAYVHTPQTGLSAFRRGQIIPLPAGGEGKTRVELCNVTG